ncbi:hypothetical protein B0J13DRAFT_159445 [Dactylonectria estremocensis]|uniref:Zn(2)-C6 fungal-type domain-containing protein n=1 Tax=Dactylonectria estremocensis TaxID=1079267 RepID=A0A9P9IJT6_9HYPO|nr:hypothetical protein B0J13DRAFT_159445 [Dactylonectria estremocensis]
MSEPAQKRRKVRKGTRSCWECRRRKIKCEFNSDEDAVCVGCIARDSPCVSQEEAAEPVPPPDRRLAQRLGRLEELMEKLVNNNTPGIPAIPKPPIPSPSESPATVPYAAALTETSGDIFDTSAAGNARQLSSFSAGETPLSNVSLPSPPPFPLKSADGPKQARHRSIAKQLHALIPSQQTLYALSQQSPGAKYVLAAFYSQQDQIDGKPPPISSLAQVPDVTSHPALLAKRLLQLAICLQQLPPYFDSSRLGLAKSPGETMAEWVAVTSRLVTTDDDLVGCLEGLECLILQSFFQSDAGHLRKAWMTSRRALNMAQLMGLDRKSAKSIRSCDASFDPQRHPSPAVLWFHINCVDRYLSLILGLSVGSRDDTLLLDTGVGPEPPSDRLGKLYSVIAGRIADRNHLTGSEAYVMTQSIDMELESASTVMDALWWKLPDMAICCNSPDPCVDEMSAVKLQVRHFSLLILLHLPYLLQAPGQRQRRYEYNRITCMQASRDVLARFLEYRGAYTQAVSGRHVDYSALIAAMTLLLGHLCPPSSSSPTYEVQRAQDRAMAETVQQKLHEMGVLNNDRLCLESAETIQQLLPIVQRPAVGGGTDDRTVHLNVPFLGTVNIHPIPTPPPSTTASLLPSTDSTPAGHPPPSGDIIPCLSYESAHCPFISMDGDMTDCPANAPANFPNWPYFTADLEDWALQGVDTTYWSMINSNITGTENNDI